MRKTKQPTKGKMKKKRVKDGGLGYTWAPINGSKLTKTQAVKVGNEISRLEERNGIAKPKDLVDESRPVTAPLHDMFTWDDSVAAEKYRIHQARNLIGSVRIVFKGSPEADQPKVRGFVHVPVKHGEDYEESGYINVIRASQDDFYREHRLSVLKQELISIKQRYADFLRFCGANKAINILVRGVDRQLNKRTKRKKGKQ